MRSLKIAHRSQQYFALLFICLGLVACDKTPEDASTELPVSDPQWSQIIASHTAGVVSRHTQIRIRFHQDVVKDEYIDTDITDGFDITPSIAGNARFTSKRELLLTPETELNADTTYLVKLDTSLLSGIPSELDEYAFSFKVKPRDFEVVVDQTSQSASQRNTVELSGRITTSDKESEKDVEALLSAKHLDAAIAINWTHNEAGLNHNFNISGITRNDKTSTLELTWNGESLASSNSGNTNIEIPALGDFSVTRTSIAKKEKQTVHVQFSEKLDDKQNLAGLVSVKEQTFKTEINKDTIIIYFDQALVGTHEIILDANIHSANGGKLGSTYKKLVTFSNQDPQLKFADNGVILPDSKRLFVPFESINLTSVQVTAFVVYENNIGQFLQNNTLSNNAGMHRVGRHLWRKTIELKAPELNQWNKQALDLSELLKKHPGALFRLTLSANRSNSIYPCAGETNSLEVSPPSPLVNYEDLNQTEYSSWDFAEDYYGGNNQVDWSQRRNPCSDAYFRYSKNVKQEKNLVASNIGLIAKRGKDNRLLIVATDLNDTTPMSDVSLELRNFQDQTISKTKTDNLGFSEIDNQQTPFYLIARKGAQIGYLKLNRGTALPTSHFDTGGEKINDGIKGFLYGERGVWRPGDDIHLGFILEDASDRIPADHPVSVRLFNPSGQMIAQEVNNHPVGSFYTFTLRTAEDAPTGNWKAVAYVGGAEFTRRLKIETVMPNRLKIELSFDSEELHKSRMPESAKIYSQWLHGAKAKGLRAVVEASLRGRKTRFTSYDDYVFDDPTRRSYTEASTVYDDNLNDEGIDSFSLQLLPANDAPGMLTANFQSRVFEASGAFSISASSTTYHPYDHYIGIKLPKGDAARNMLLTDVDHEVSIASVDTKGDPISVKNIKVSIYKAQWKWWWDTSAIQGAQYYEASNLHLIDETNVETNNGKASWKFQVNYPGWGRYLVRACDVDGGHCTATYTYIDWPGWAGRSQEQSGAGASALYFGAEKTEYEVGETARLKLPDNISAGRALLSIENGSRIINHRWVNIVDHKTAIEIPITKAMTPNIYVSLTVLQGVQNKDNDRPLRLYGVIPLLVSDPKTSLQPQIKSEDSWRPRTQVSVEVSEEEDRQMYYTLAVVDEGLLGLTNFKTPDAYQHFFRREALGVSTWDLFDQVAGAYSGELQTLLSLGGDGSGKDDKNARKKRRFPPVVRFLGPFELKAGKSNKHDIDIPQYIGAVRIMVIAGTQKAYGSAEKTVTVREPLSLLATLPRVLGPGETFTLPVALFSYDEDIRTADVSLETSDGLEIINASKGSVDFTSGNEAMLFFELRSKMELGKVEVKLKASANSHSAETKVYLDVRSSNQPVITYFRKELDAEESWDSELPITGLKNTNSVTLEASYLPSFDLHRHLQYLIRYPHGCVEQLTSAAFPQLYLSKLLKLQPEAATKTEKHIHTAIERLRRYQARNGAFSYWPGNYKINAWANNYAGHFLVEAKRLGYFIPGDMYDNWLSYQGKQARNWITGAEAASATQAYRLYTLAAAGAAEIGAMNRMRESQQLDNLSLWQLAAAYKLSGLQEAAEELAAKANISTSSYNPFDLSFGSATRDRAIMLDALSILGQYDRAQKLTTDIISDLRSSRWHSTQTVAYSLAGLSRYMLTDGQTDAANIKVLYQLKSETPISFDTAAAIMHQPLVDFPQQSSKVKLTNQSQRKLYASFAVEGAPLPGNETAEQNGLQLKVDYYDKSANSIDIDKLIQSTDFVAVIKVSNRSGTKLNNIALTQVVPAGWEIRNPRLNEEGAAEFKADYQDIRDDRLLTYFSLDDAESREFRVAMNAAYLGRYYLPSILVAPMYDETQFARTAGLWVEVIKPE